MPVRSGERYRCDLAVLGLGIDLVVEPGQRRRVRAWSRVIVDELCRTSVDGVLAAADVAHGP